MSDKCELCGSTLTLRTRRSGEKAGHRYWVCSEYPRCRFTKFYAEQGNAGVWRWFLEKGKFYLKLK